MCAEQNVKSHFENTRCHDVPFGDQSHDTYSFTKNLVNHASFPKPIILWPGQDFAKVVLWWQRRATVFKWRWKSGSFKILRFLAMGSSKFPNLLLIWHQPPLGHGLALPLPGCCLGSVP